MRKKKWSDAKIREQRVAKSKANWDKYNSRGVFDESYTVKPRARRIEITDEIRAKYERLTTKEQQK